MARKLIDSYFKMANIKKMLRFKLVRQLEGKANRGKKYW